MPAVKYETYGLYDPVGVANAERAFLTVWAALGSWRDDLVLVGGLVPKYLCGDFSAPRSLPRTNAALAGFGEEVRIGNPACADVVACVREHFRDEQASAPIRAANFVLGQPAAGESEDMRFRRRQIQQDMVDAGRLLQKAIAA